MPETLDDTTEAELRRYKALATGCLVLAGGAWGATHALDMPPVWGSAVRAMAEAGLVGGLADWFAVTALFRRPLGLPIPHTALIPRNRDRIADGIATYIDREFLEPGMLVEQLRRMDLADRIAKLLKDEASRARLVDLIMGFLPDLIGEKDAAIRSTVTRALQDALKQVDLRRPVSRILRALVESDALEPLLTEFSDRLIMMVQDRRGWLMEAVEKKSKWWIPKAVDQRVAGNLASAAIDHLYDLRSPHSDVGADLRRWLNELPNEVEQGGPIGERLIRVVGSALEDTNFAALVDRAIVTLRRIALEDLETGGESRIRQVVEAAVASLAEQLDDAELRGRINQSLEDAFVGAIPRWREKIKTFITGTLRGQDVEEFTRRLEVRVGRDLQYIRINGTILGAGIGGLLWLLNGWLD